MVHQEEATTTTHSSMEATTTKSFATPEIISRLASLPLVGGTWDSMTSVYNYGKQTQFSPLLDSMEAAVTVVATKSTELAMPIIEKHQDTVSNLDAVACSSLDTLQAAFEKKREEAASAVGRAKEAKDGAVARFNTALNEGKQLVTKTTTTAISTCGSVADEVVDSVKPVISKVANTQVAKTCTSVATASLSKLGETKDMAVSTATDAALGTANMVDSKVSGISNYALGFAESTLDFALPAPDKDEEMTNEEEIATEKTEMMIGAETAKAVQRAYNLTTKARARAYGKALSELQNLKTRSEETVETLKIHTVNLLDYASDMLDIVDADEADTSMVATESEEEQQKTVTKSLVKLKTVILSTSSATLKTTVKKMKEFPLFEKVVYAAEASLERGASAAELVLPPAMYERITSFINMNGVSHEEQDGDVAVEDVEEKEMVKKAEEEVKQVAEIFSDSSEESEPLTIHVKKNRVDV